ncbi:MAG: DKNYY domain-containing protein, partial [Gemmatimonas sp.]
RDGKEYWSIKHYRTDKIPGADAPTFQMLNSQYARDSRMVYTDGLGFSVRDVDTYERIGDMHGKDRVAGYYLRAEIKGSDGATFSEVSSHYSKDRAHVWWSDYTSGAGAHRPVEVSFQLPDADPATFVMLEDYYAADTNQVYYEARVLSKAPAKFRVLGRAYAVTETEVFYEGKVLKGADAATFTVLPVSPDSATAQDKHGQFNYEKRVKR